MSLRRRARPGFALAVLAVIAALTALTWAALRLEADERRARADALDTDRTRRALWRIDSWMGAWLAAETARPVEDYFSQGDSPVFSPLILSRFQHAPAGWSHAGEPFPPRWLDGKRLRAAIRAVEDELHRRLTDTGDPALDARIATCVAPADRPGGHGPGIGPVLPLFMEPPPPDVGPMLLLSRRVVLSTGERLQGVVVDWDALATRLLGVLAEEDVGLFALRTGPAGAGVRLATLPARLERQPPPAPAPAPLWTPVRGAVALAWVLVLAALGLLGVALRRNLELVARRERFALAVTHELRTPLTTLRMYAGMLAGGMIEEPGRRQEYLQILRRQADRLGNLVENVLSFARLERAPAQLAPRSIPLQELLDEVLPAIRLQAERSGMRLSVVPIPADGRSVRADVDTVGQVLSNLVDNAAKYAAGEGRSLRLQACAAADGFVGLRLTDSGPGVADADTERIFAAFERGTGTDPAVPGLGLGLGLARALARRIGGDLVLEPPRPEGGAAFRLDLAVADRGAC